MQNSKSSFNCLLIHTPNLSQNSDGTLFSEVNFCAMGLFSLAGEIKKEGFNVEIIHLGIEKYLDKNFSLASYVKENNIKFIAFSLHWHPQSFDVIESAKILKEQNPNVFIALGGFTASYFKNEIMENFPFVDAVMKGEGEKTIRKLTKRLYETMPFVPLDSGVEMNLSDIENLVWRKGLKNSKAKIIENNEVFIAKNEDLDEFDYFNPSLMRHYGEYSKVSFELQYSKAKQLNNPKTAHGVSLGRGCLGNCTWCGGGYNAMKMVTGRDFISYRGAKSVIDEVKKLQKNEGIEFFCFCFDPNPKDRTYLIGLMKELKNEFNGKLNAFFTLYGLPDKEFLNTFKSTFSKESVISLSPEFFDESLRKFHKSFFFSNKELEEILEYMEELEIHSDVYFSIIPAVDEFHNEESRRYGKFLKEKYSFVKDYYIIPIIQEPASPWTITPEEYGLPPSKKNFINYYNDTNCIKKSFENSEFFTTKPLK